MVVGGELDSWDAMSDDDWERRTKVLATAAERHGARYVSVFPYGARGGSANDIERRIEIEGVRVTVSRQTDGRERIAAALRVAPNSPRDERSIESILHGDAGESDLVVVLGPPDRLPPSLVWELAYSELVFVDIDWRELDVDALDDALDVFHGRERRFGGVDE